MLKKYMLLMLAVLFILAGCSGEKKVDKAESAQSDAGSADQKEAGKDNEEEGSEVTDEISTVVIPSTVEEFRNAEPGLLTKDFSYEKETALWPDFNTLSGIREDFEGHMQKVTKETNDPDMMFKALLYYLGNSAYQQSIGRIMDYEPQFDEPLLPEPEQAAQSETGEEQEDGKALLLLDASSSMLLDVDGKQKMEIAKSAVRSFAKTIGEENDVSLYVYGHAGTQEDKDKQISCTTIDEVYPLQSYNEESFFKAVEGVEAKGWTPLAGAIKAAREASMDYEGDITLYIVSDGAETCDGNPVEEARLFAETNESRKVNIIGFNVDKEAEDQLKKVAEAGKGEYIGADNADQLNSSISNEWVPGLIDIIGVKWSTPKNTFAVSFQKMDIDQMGMGLGYAIRNEAGRIRDAIANLKENELIDAAMEEELLKKTEEHEKVLEGLQEEIINSKHQEIDDEVERIDQKINDWAERMEKLRENR
ncbi:VWA domain-containing protein [Bacillus infantis]|uniref:vWA domain-containing protein n=1 Tax=Bacillus infantis TaxID=324767 RepID=UPI001CD55BC2|nr:VWA domain-containing protein [Bacillus infantis]MCA1037795.1 VWA domain-containing protein [Bacillus infantis]